jgi:putative glutamine amidotransferase
MVQPVIGICAALEQARWSYWDQEAFLIPRSYVDAVQRAGGIAVLVPADEAVVADPDLMLDMIDGLMLAGGADIDPSNYGEEPHPKTVATVPERDRFELALTRGALERDIPFLGICRGMQLLNIACGGTLIQDLPERFGHHDHRRVRGTFDGADHDVRLAPGSLAADSAGEELHSTKSHHHQGIAEIGDELVVSGWSVMDDLPEAVELPDRRFALGVQWHPEADETSGLIAALVAEATEHALARRSPAPAK